LILSCFSVVSQLFRSCFVVVSQLFRSCFAIVSQLFLSYLQEFVAKGVARLMTIESRQDALDGTMSAVKATVNNT
jgi:hypothetical protein